MRVLLSPAKTFRKEGLSPEAGASQPLFMKEAGEIMQSLSTWSPKELSEKMDISPQLAEETAQRHLNWSAPFHPGNAKLAVLAFHGEVYRALGAERWNAADFDFAQERLRIISGLYGWLRPLDLIQEYRLEMGTKWAPNQENNLYGFWGDQLAQSLAKDADSGTIVNLASAEYAKAMRLNTLDTPVVTCTFKEERDHGFKLIGTYAKHARGRMAGFIVKERISKVSDLLDFNEGGYSFNEQISTEDQFVFTRASKTAS